MKYTRTDNDDETTITVEGTLDETTAPEFRTLVDELCAANRWNVTLELSMLTSIDSVGVGVIVLLHKQVRAKGGEVRLVGLDGQPRAIFRLLRLDKVFSF
ncbi:STAS domain-containing protein [Polyangium jinanense]|uniref:STAS domain-containing protein n=1 Tax=Polyangium jinanense TaxID=2829994 RepID=UPI002342787F|nr:STAS domain-containing protein [Polyangium jinanense]MDC3962803.1 STAS domain-containing protein [Polyangium jinanense]